MIKLPNLLCFLLTVAVAQGAMVLQVNPSNKTLRMSGQMSVQYFSPANTEHYRAAFDNPIGPFQLDNFGQTDWQLFEGSDSPYSGYIPFNSSAYIFSSENPINEGYIQVSAIAPTGDNPYGSYFPGFELQFWFVDHIDAAEATHTYTGSEIEFSYTNDWLWNNPLTQLPESLTPTSELINIIESAFSLLAGSSSNNLPASIAVETIPEARTFALILGLFVLWPTIRKRLQKFRP